MMILLAYVSSCASKYAEEVSKVVGGMPMLLLFLLQTVSCVIDYVEEVML